MTSWGELAADVRAAFEWAAAMEPFDVGTRTLLIGIIRAGNGRTDPEQLLQAFDCPKDQLFKALQAAAPRPQIRPYVSQPAHLDDLPRLSPNCRQVLERAAALRNSTDPKGEVTPEHVFAAILDFRKSTAHRGLQEVVGASLEEVRRLYSDYRRDATSESFAELLRLRYPALQGGSRQSSKIHVGRVNDLCFSPDGEELASAGADGIVAISYPYGDRPPLLLTSPESKDAAAEMAIAYSADGGRLFCGNARGSVRAWQRGAEGRWVPLESQLDYSRGIRAIVSSALGFVAVTDAGGRLMICDQDLRPVAECQPGDADGSSVQISKMAFSAEGNRLVSTDGGGTLRLWDPATGSMVGDHRPRDPLASRVLTVGFEDKTIVFIREDGTANAWDPFDQMYAQIGSDLTAGPPAVATLSADGSFWVSAHTDDSIRLNEGRHQILLGHHLARVHSTAISPDNKQVASGDQDGQIHVWSIRESPLRDTAVDWQLDSPAQGIERDELGRVHLAKALSTRLAHMAATSPTDSFLLHVEGPWGSGKSTILGLLEKELKTGSVDWLGVQFDAWRQSRIGPPWWALLTSLRTAQQKGMSAGGRLRFRVAEAIHRLAQAWFSYLISLLLVGIALGGFFLLDPFEGDVSKALRLLSGGIALTTTIWLIANTAARFLMWESATAARLYEQSHQNPMETLAAHFGWLMKRAKTRVIFFIDDLDRCDEKYVVDLLDSVQTLVRDAPATGRGGTGKPPYFVVAADGRWIRCSYEHVYETFDDAVREPGRPLGYLFLDKIFQLSVRVPTIGSTQQRRYLDHLLNRPAETAAEGDLNLDKRKQLIEESVSQEEVLAVVNSAPPAAQPELRAAAVEQLATPEVAQHTEHGLQKFAALLESNPRSMKRFVNAYSMGLSTALLEERSIDPDQLALWTIVRTRWPDLADQLILHPALLESLRSGDGESDGTLPKRLLSLATDRDVRELLSFKDPALDGKAIRALCGAVDSDRKEIA